MNRVERFTFNPFQENTYLIINANKEVLIVDPGNFMEQETKALIDYIEDNQLSPLAIINTHCHIDHIMGVQSIRHHFQIPFYIFKDDEIILNNAGSSAAMFGLPWQEQPSVDAYIDIEQGIQLGGFNLHVRHVPGHSPGSVIFYDAEAKLVIVGDTLFNHSIGRTDLPGGNHAQLITAIQTELFTLDDDVIVYPGHGDATTIGAERQHNPFF